jgi:alpha-tubulin suppressor-like RCC1 family protein
MSALINIQRKSSKRRTGSLLVTFVAALFAAIGLLLIAVERTDAQTKGEVWAWGWNDDGQLGDGTNTSSNTPLQVSGLSDVQAVAGGDFHSLALKNDGTVWAWGANGDGQLGDGTAGNKRTTPVQVRNLSDVQAVAGGWLFSLALKNNGTVWGWGSNAAGQLGDGTISNQRNTPVQVSDLSDVQAIDAGTVHSLALKNDGTVWAWGRNAEGQLGVGTFDFFYTTPVQVSNLSDVQAIAAGDRYSLALKNDGTVWAWGSNDEGQLGDGTSTSSNTPVQVSGLSDVQDIAAGGFHALALKNDGTVWGWGRNVEGQLGDGTNTQSNTPVQVSGLSDVQAVAGGWSHSLALKNDGTVWGWGRNAEGQRGDGTNNYSYNTPLQVSGLSGVQDIAAGAYHSLAVPPDATLPEVSSTIPKNNATGVSTTAPITATFSEDVDVPSGNSWFTVKSVRTGTLVSGQLSYDASTKTATFRGTLNRGDAFKATITTEVKDKAGNALAQPYTWQFTTAGPKPKR